MQLEIVKFKKNTMSLIEDLKWRHAVKAYDPTKKVSEEDLNKILNQHL